jgi:hypothetical protein
MSEVAFVGPGSEWFWAMLQFIVVAVTLLGIYYQLRLTRSANNFEQARRIAADVASERMARNQLEILLALQDGVIPEHLPEGPVTYIQDYWENVAGLVRGGHLEPALLDRFAGNSCRWWWAALAPNVRHHRVTAGNPRDGENWEWLALILAKLEQRGGVDRVFGEIDIRSGLERGIERARSRIKVAEDLRRSPPARSAGPAARPKTPSRVDHGAGPRTSASGVSAMGG